MSRRVSGLTGLMSLMVLGLVLAMAPGCTHGRGFYGFHWSYCKFFGYPKLLDCIAPPPADLFVLPPVREPDDNPASKEKAELGKLLFFDERLSSTGKVSCATCHAPEKAFADRPNRVSKGIKDQKGRRNAPTALNSAFYRFLFWDGRAASLEAQAEAVLKNDKEMGPEADLDARVARLNRDPDTRARFERAFGSPEVTVPRIAMALATFERTLILGKTAFARWVEGKEPMPSWSAERGWEVFRSEKAQCANCHTPPLYHDNNFHIIGIPRHPADKPDLGRYEHLSRQTARGNLVKPQEADSSKCAFKTPTLLHVAGTDPYMHDGTLETLEDVVAFYARFNPDASYARTDSQADEQECGTLDEKIVKIKGMLAPDEQMDLVEFLRSLSPTAGVYREFLDNLGLPSGH